LNCTEKKGKGEGEKEKDLRALRKQIKSKAKENQYAHDLGGSLRRAERRKRPRGEGQGSQVTKQIKIGGIFCPRKFSEREKSEFKKESRALTQNSGRHGRAISNW